MHLEGSYTHQSSAAPRRLGSTVRRCVGPGYLSHCKSVRTAFLKKRLRPASRYQRPFPRDRTSCYGRFGRSIAFLARCLLPRTSALIRPLRRSAFAEAAVQGGCENPRYCDRQWRHAAMFWMTNYRPSPRVGRKALLPLPITSRPFPPSCSTRAFERA